MSYGFLAFADFLAVVAMVVILRRLLGDYARGELTTKTLLVGGAFFLAIFGLFMAGAQTLVAGPGL